MLVQTAQLLFIVYLEFYLVVNVRMALFLA